MEILRNRLSDAVRDIRNCSQGCTGGKTSYVEEFEGMPYWYSRRCRCLGAWKDRRKELMWEFLKLSKVEKAQYPDLITDDMLNWKKVSVSNGDVVTPERMGEILRSEANKGNPFAEMMVKKLKIPEKETIERW